MVSALEEQFAMQLSALKLCFEREHKFHPTRKWRFDFAFPQKMLAVEIEGGVWSGGRHTTGAGFVKDCEKYNAAALLGWRVLRYTNAEIKSGIALKEVEVALNGLQTL